VIARRFPPPWSVEELDACFVVRDNSGQSRFPAPWLNSFMAERRFPPP
jgi:hypothetical protein